MKVVSFLLLKFFLRNLKCNRLSSGISDAIYIWFSPIKFVHPSLLQHSPSHSHSGKRWLDWIRHYLQHPIKADRAGQLKSNYVSWVWIRCDQHASNKRAHASLLFHFNFFLQKNTDFYDSVQNWQKSQHASARLRAAFVKICSHC